MLNLIYDGGHSGDLDLATEAIRVTRQLLAVLDEPEVAALHADARRVEETDRVQIVEWYDELIALTDSPVARLNRAVAVGEADGARAGPAALAEVDAGLPRHVAASAHLHEKAGAEPGR